MRKRNASLQPPLGQQEMLPAGHRSSLVLFTCMDCECRRLVKGMVTLGFPCHNSQHLITIGARGKCKKLCSQMLLILLDYVNLFCKLCGFNTKPFSSLATELNLHYQVGLVTKGEAVHIKSGLEWAPHCFPKNAHKTVLATRCAF